MVLSLKRKVIGLAIPAGLKQLLDMAQLWIDMLMVGSLGVAALAAVGLSMQFMMLIQAFMTLYVTGAGVLIARNIGARRRKHASSILYTALWFSIGFSFIVGVIGWNFGKELFLIMGSEEDVGMMGEEYFSILSAGMVLIFLDALAYHALSSAGDTKSSLLIKIFSALLNAFLNYLFIFGHGGFEAMGIAGAAYATLCAYFFNLIVYGWIFFHKGGALDIVPLLRLKDLSRLLRIGSPAAAERVIGTGSFLLFVAIIASYGTSALAGYQIGLRIEALAFMPGFGFSVAAMALAGQSLGAKKTEEAYASGMVSLKIAMIFMGSVGIILFIFAEFLASFFTQDPDTIAEAALYLKLVGISQIPLSVTFVASGSLRGTGATYMSMRISILSLWCFRIIPSLALAYGGFSILWVYVAMTIETFIKGLWFWRVFQAKKWLETKV